MAAIALLEALFLLFTLFLCLLYINSYVTLYGLMSPQNKDLEKEIMVWGL